MRVEPEILRLEWRARLNLVIDPAPKDDVVIDFGPGVGTWKWMNDSAWVPLHGLSPEVMVTGNVDGL